MRQKPKRLTRQRAQTDARLASLHPLAALAIPPRGGWLKTIRESLGMTAEQAGRRIGIGKQAVLMLEANEVRGTVSLKSLQKVAGALGCRLAYAIVPEQPLETLVAQRARAVAIKKLARVSHSMALEAQKPSPELDAVQLEELSKEIRDKLGRELWDEA